MMYKSNNYLLDNFKKINMINIYKIINLINIYKIIMIKTNKNKNKYSY